MTENERLTHARASGIKSGYWSNAKKDELIARLAEYEDTDVTPAGVKAMLQMGLLLESKVLGMHGGHDGKEE